jgi:hypothetical protein
MRLASINEGTKRSDDAGRRRRRPWNAEAASQLFERGVAALRAGDEDHAFAVFDCLADYTGEAPAGLVDAARLGRDLTDPSRTPQELADQFFALFPGRVVHIFDVHRGEGATELPPDNRHGERGRQ